MKNLWERTEEREKECKLNRIVDNSKTIRIVPRENLHWIIILLEGSWKQWKQKGEKQTWLSRHLVFVWMWLLKVLIFRSKRFFWRHCFPNTHRWMKSSHFIIGQTKKFSAHTQKQKKQISKQSSKQWKESIDILNNFFR